MRNIYPILFCLLVAGAFVSCQKSYAPDGVTIGGGTGSGGTTIGTGSQLVKFTSTEAAGTSEYTYEYNSSGQLVKVVLTGTVSGQTIIEQWRLLRDANGKLTQYSLKINIPGYPDSVLYTLHYPGGSTNFDYALATYTFSGGLTKDSLAYTVTGTVLAKEDSYQSYGNAAYQHTSSASYSYDGNGNIAMIDSYADNGSGLVHDSNYKYEYDNKLNALQLGQEAFIFYPYFISKNNYIKETFTDYSTSSTGTQSVNNFSFQYNGFNKPISAVVSQVGSTGTAQQTFTYR